jgi:hypothetical protein
MSVRRLTPEEQQRLDTGRHSADAFTLRRCQSLLASARRQRPVQMARQLGCATQRGRPTSHAFQTRGMASVPAPSRRPKRTRLGLDAAP